MNVGKSVQERNISLRFSITLTRRPRDVSPIKSIARHSKCFTSFQLSTPSTYGIPADRSFEERSSATVDAIAPSNFPDFSCTNFRSGNECEGRGDARRWRNMLSHKGRKGRFSVDGLLSNTRVHISISAMHDKTPGWTRDDKNEEELLWHSNRAIFGSSLRQCRAILITFCKYK